ncbi:hypothetical protein GW17_00004469 [Ensete ventricosum]|uniref:Secreted protein n=1 Tax=Ensete ventricosum TaxID=4639 RepID=A0A444G7Q9_ENSVE|nr:hypothetical protein B296_00036918 [Ensete ventricosum]RWW30926.1 hypothetical protein GW17_00004469 [Ensete ventricosum]RZR72423.1 hypothetical protein BHM03_00013358 [Ensete ventricosum]
MDARLVVNLSLLIVASSLCLQARVCVSLLFHISDLFTCIGKWFVCLVTQGESRGSVVFLDGSSQRYFRKDPQDAAGKVNLILCCWLWLYLL